MRFILALITIVMVTGFSPLSFADGAYCDPTSEIWEYDSCIPTTPKALACIAEAIQSSLGNGVAVSSQEALDALNGKGNFANSYDAAWGSFGFCFNQN